MTSTVDPRGPFDARAFLKETHSATLGGPNATRNKTAPQQPSVKELASMIYEEARRNRGRNTGATEALRPLATAPCGKLLAPAPGAPASEPSIQELAERVLREARLREPRRLDRWAAPAECPHCAAPTAPYLLISTDGSAAVVCMGACRHWIKAQPATGGAALVAVERHPTQK